MIKILKETRTKVILLLAFFAFGLLTLKILTPKKELNIVNTQPENGQKQVSLEASIIVVFDRLVENKNWEISFQPQEEFSFEIIENRLVITPKTKLKPETNYLLEIRNIFYKKTPTQVSFSTQSLPEKNGLGDPDFHEELAKKILKYRPLMPELPYQTNNWKLNYSGPLELTIILKRDTSDIRQEVFDWIKSKGVDPATHKIIWKKS